MPDVVAVWAKTGRLVHFWSLILSKESWSTRGERALFESNEDGDGRADKNKRRRCYEVVMNEVEQEVVVVVVQGDAVVEGRQRNARMPLCDDAWVLFKTRDCG
jgi:hypothetical protein